MSTKPPKELVEAIMMGMQKAALPWYKVTIEKHNEENYPGGRSVSSSDQMFGLALGDALDTFDGDKLITINLPLAIAFLEKARGMHERIKEHAPYLVAEWDALVVASERLLEKINNQMAQEEAAAKVEALAALAKVKEAAEKGEPCPGCGKIHSPNEVHSEPGPQGFVAKVGKA